MDVANIDSENEKGGTAHQSPSKLDENSNEARASMKKIIENKKE